MNVWCSKCGESIEGLPESSSEARIYNPICGCDNLDDSHAQLVEKLVVQKLREIDEQPGHNLHKAYQYLNARKEWRLLKGDGGLEKLERYGLYINQMVAGMIMEEGRKVTRNFSMMEETKHGIKQSVEDLRRRDRDRICGAGYAIPPWDNGVLHYYAVPEEEEEDEYENIDEFIEEVNDGVPDLISESKIFEERIQENLRKKNSPIVKKTREDHTGVDVKLIGTAHKTWLMLEDIKKELEECDLIMVESSSTESLSPSTMVGHRAALAQVSYLNGDIIEVLEGYPDQRFVGEDPGGYSLLSLFKSGGVTHDLKERQKKIDDHRGKDPEYFTKVVDERDHKFALQAIEHIIDNYYERGIDKVAVVAGKDHIPGIYQYFDSIGFGEDEREKSNIKSEDEESNRITNDSAFDWG